MLAPERSTLERVFRTVYSVRPNVLALPQIDCRVVPLNQNSRQISVFDATVDSTPIVRVVFSTAIPSTGLQAPGFSRGLRAAHLRRSAKSPGRRSDPTSFPAPPSSPSREQRPERLLTDFRGRHSDVVPHVRLPVQRLGQRDLPVVDVNVELPLQVRVAIDDIPVETRRKVVRNLGQNRFLCPLGVVRAHLLRGKHVCLFLRRKIISNYGSKDQSIQGHLTLQVKRLKQEKTLEKLNTRMIIDNRLIDLKMGNDSVFGMSGGRVPSIGIMCRRGLG